MEVDYSYIIRPLLEDDDLSGDIVYINDNNKSMSFGVIDGLGHGKNAHNAAILALNHLKKNNLNDPALLINSVHALLFKSVGAVIGLCYLEKETGILTTSGVGNIIMRLIGSKRQKIFYQDGIVGINIPRLKNQVFKVYPGDVIVMYSDGVKENIDLFEMPDILKMSSEDIANELFTRYSKDSDDASILTIKICYD